MLQDWVSSSPLDAAPWSGVTQKALDMLRAPVKDQFNEFHCRQNGKVKMKIRDFNHQSIMQGELNEKFEDVKQNMAASFEKFTSCRWKSIQSEFN